MKLVKYVVAGAVVALGCGGPIQQQEGETETTQEGLRVDYGVRPDGKGLLPKGSWLPNPDAPSAAAGSNGINYHGGPVLLGNVDIYFIWYGNWSGNTAKTILPAWAQSFGGSPYYNINTTYYNGSGQHLSNAATLAGQTTDNYSHGKNLSDAAIKSIVSGAISSGKLPKNTHALYFVLTSADVNETSGFCSFYCGWHNHGTIAGSNIKYAFVGNPDQCPSSCEEQTSGSPNGNTGADGMVSVMSHEFEETTSDPNLNAWYDDATGMENADKCAWTFGKESTASNGSKYNIVLGGKEYLIQRNWVNASGGYCSMHYP